MLAVSEVVAQSRTTEVRVGIAHKFTPKYIYAEDFEHIPLEMIQKPEPPMIHYEDTCWILPPLHPISSHSFYS
jgi:hypothetical protein